MGKTVIVSGATGVPMEDTHEASILKSWVTKLPADLVTSPVRTTGRHSVEQLYVNMALAVNALSTNLVPPVAIDASPMNQLPVVIGESVEYPLNRAVCFTRGLYHSTAVTVEKFA